MVGAARSPSNGKKDGAGPNKSRKERNMGKREAMRFSKLAMALAIAAAVLAIALALWGCAPKATTPATGTARWT